MNEFNAAKVREHLSKFRPPLVSAEVAASYEILLENFEYELETGELHENLRWDAYVGLPSAKRDAKVIGENYRQSLGRGWNGREDVKALSRLLDEAGLF